MIALSYTLRFLEGVGPADWMKVSAVWWDGRSQTLGEMSGYVGACSDISPGLGSVMLAAQSKREKLKLRIKKRSQLPECVRIDTWTSLA